jgi:hypothetical protein
MDSLELEVATADVTAVACPRSLGHKWEAAIPGFPANAQKQVGEDEREGERGERVGRPVLERLHSKKAW